MEEGRLDMNTIFTWALLGKIGVRFLRMGVGVQLLHKDKLKSEIFNENKFINKNFLLCQFNQFIFFRLSTSFVKLSTSFNNLLIYLFI